VNPEGEGAGKDVVVTVHDASKKTFVRGASAAGTTGNDAKAEVHAAELPVTRVPEADAAKIRGRVEIPQQPEV
jgi:hypothetical protein